MRIANFKPQKKCYWTCLVAKHEHLTEQEAVECLERYRGGHNNLEKKERNIEIAIALLNGAKAKDVAHEHDLSPARVTTIVRNTIQKAYSELANEFDPAGELEKEIQRVSFRPLKDMERWLPLILRYKEL